MKQPKTVDIEFSGEVWTLRLDLNALCGLSEEGHDMDSLRDLLKDGKTTLSVIRLMLWAFLISAAEDRGLTPFTKKTVGKWITSENMAYCGKKLAEFLNAQPKAEQPEASEPTANPTPAE